VVAQLVDEGKDQVVVLFQGHDGVFHLQRNHPDFERLSHLLSASASGGRRVWFVAEPLSLALLDALEVTPRATGAAQANGAGSP
jgi:hypothetical protein